MTLPFLNLGSSPIPTGGTYWWAGAFIAEMTGIPSEEAFGTPSLGKIIGVPGIPSGEAFGATTLTYNQDITFDGIDEGGVGEPVVSHAENQIARTVGIPSAEAFGTTDLLRGWLLEPFGIPSEESFGLTSIPAAPRFDSVGAGYAANLGLATNFQFSHNGSASAYLVVDIAFNRPMVGVAVTYDGAPMTLIATADLGTVAGGGPGHYFRYGLANIPAGTKNVRVSWTSGTGYVSANSASYLGVSSVGSAELTPLTTGGSLSQSTTTASAQLAVQAFAGNNSNGAPLAALSGGTNRFNAGNQFAQLSISDSAAASPTFTGTASEDHGTQYWLGCINKLLASIPVLNPAGIASAEAFGTASLLVASPQTITPSGIASAEAFGTPTMVPTQFITPAGLTSAEAFGTATTGLALLPSGIATAEAFGTQAVANAAVLAVDALGAGSTGAGTTRSWTHTATAGSDVYVIVSGGPNATITATYDGVAMTSLGSSALNNLTGNGRLQIFRLAGAPGGAKTVVVTFNVSVNASAQSISVVNSVSVGAFTGNNGSSTALAQSATLAAGQLVIQAFAANNTGASPLTSLSGGTNRYNDGFLTGGVYRSALAINTATASASFAATSGSSTPWAGAYVVIS